MLLEQTSTKRSLTTDNKDVVNMESLAESAVTYYFSTQAASNQTLIARLAIISLFKYDGTYGERQNNKKGNEQKLLN